MTNEQWADKIVCRYTDGHEAKQRLWDGEDKVLVDEITRLRQVLSEAALSAAEPSVKALQDAFKHFKVVYDPPKGVSINEATRRKAIEVASSALTAQVQDVAVPDGWQLVPKEPTADMIQSGKLAQSLAAGFGEDWGVQMKDIYLAMLTSSPAKQDG